MRLRRRCRQKPIHFVHFPAIFNPSKASEASESETDNKRSLSKSPVKRAKIKNSTKSKPTPVPNNKKASPVSEERKCPVEGCDSIGHLSGNNDKHFTQEACPLFHNMPLSETKSWSSERKQHDEEREKAIILFDPLKKQLTVEQKAYQLKVREIRSKFKPISPSPTRQMNGTLNQQLMAEKATREPSLAGLVSDYDTQLFREAQAISSEKMENDLMKLPPEKGTKFITMGRHNMEVWYQSPYPEDAARLPKLYLCEFCLRYQKSEVGMKRHAAKCVWRHPPGDEVCLGMNRVRKLFY